MDVSAIQISQVASDSAGLRTVVAGPTPTSAGSDVQVNTFSQTYAGSLSRSGQPGMVGLVDRLRVDYQAFRARMGETDIVGETKAGSASSAKVFETVMKESLRTQVDIFELSISFNAGLTATQQSQSGVKTLVEKT